MAELTEEQKKQVEETLKKIAADFNPNNTVKVIITGGGPGVFETDNPRFVIERRRE